MEKLLRYFIFGMILFAHFIFLIGAILLFIIPSKECTSLGIFYLGIFLYQLCGKKGPIQAWKDRREFLAIKNPKIEINNRYSIIKKKRISKKKLIKQYYARLQKIDIQDLSYQ